MATEAVSKGRQRECSHMLAGVAAAVRSMHPLALRLAAGFVLIHNSF